MKKKIAIIGAGISGIAIARALENVASVSVFEKARGVGGRMSTRYADPFYFDHGAQCFTARTKEFQDFLAPYTKQGIITQWQGKVINLELGKSVSKRLWFEPHLLASPNMNSLCKQMAESVNILTGIEVAPLTQKQPDGWHVQDKDGSALGIFDIVISTAPPEQTVRLMNTALPADSPVRRAKLYGCYSLMIGFNRPWDKAWIAAKVRNNPIKWISINSTKPGRNENVTCIVVHTRNQWAEDHINDEVKDAESFLVGQFEAVTGIDCSAADYLSTHRWRYAIVEETEKSGPFFNHELGIGCSSDWSYTSRIEEVWISAQQLARSILPHVNVSN